MMQFDQLSRNVFVATNTTKRVEINRFGVHSDLWMVFTPDGRHDDDFTSAGPFVSFEAAKRNAEMNVGMQIDWPAEKRG